MAIKNYYAILGVTRDETPSGIRAAYRDAVRRTHPDHAGPEAAPAFQDVMEAHSILSDPDRRREYNETLRLHERDRAERGMRRSFAPDWEPLSIFADPHSVHPSFETLAERLLRNFTGRGVPKAEGSEALTVEVILTAEEAAQGGVLWIGVPVHQLCSACRGSGEDWLFPCLSCRGNGTVSRIRPVQIRIPRSISQGLMPETSLHTLGIDNLFLKVRIRLANQQQ